MGTQCKRACMGPVCVCMEILQASARGDPVSQHVWDPASKHVWGPGVCVRACVDPSGTDTGVRGSIGHEHGCAGGIQQVQAWACVVDPAGTNTGMWGSSRHDVVIIPCASKHSVKEKKGSLTLQGLCRVRAWE